MTIAGICELVLETDDVDRLREFYEGLGLKRLATENPLADTILRVRNGEALTRLKRLVEGVPEGEPLSSPRPGIDPR